MQSQTWRERSANRLKDKTVLLLGQPAAWPKHRPLLGANLAISVLGVTHSGLRTKPYFNRCYSFDALPSALQTSPASSTRFLITRPRKVLFRYGVLSRALPKHLFINIGRGQSFQHRRLKLRLRHRPYSLLDCSCFMTKEPLPAASGYGIPKGVFHLAASGPRFTDIDDIATRLCHGLASDLQKAPNTFLWNRDKSY